MKQICDFCSHQKQGINGHGVGCGVAVVHLDRDGYGEFKHGAQCVHDSDLHDWFEPRTGEEISIKNMVRTIEILREELNKATHTIAELKTRLTKVDV